MDVACQTSLLSSCIALSFHITRKNYSTLFHSFGRRSFFIFKKIFQESLLSSFMFVPFHTFRKKPFDHSFLSKGIEFSVFFTSFIYHSSLLYQSMLCGGGGFCTSIFFHPALLCHSILGNNYSTLIHSFDRELNLYIYIAIFVTHVTQGKRQSVVLDKHVSVLSSRLRKALIAGGSGGRTRSHSRG